MLVIKGKKMPNNCIFCPLYVGKKGEGHCVITHKWNATGGLNRLDDCPLMEIVTCKDCKHLCHIEDVHKALVCGKHNCQQVSKNYYCADGERREK
jgi:hypothetical protein